MPPTPCKQSKAGLTINDVCPDVLVKHMMAYLSVSDLRRLVCVGKTYRKRIQRGKSLLATCAKKRLSQVTKSRDFVHVFIGQCGPDCVDLRDVYLSRKKSDQAAAASLNTPFKPYCHHIIAGEPVKSASLSQDLWDVLNRSQRYKYAALAQHCGAIEDEDRDVSSYQGCRLNVPFRDQVVATPLPRLSVVRLEFDSMQPWYIRNDGSDVGCCWLCKQRYRVENMHPIDTRDLIHTQLLETKMGKIDYKRTRVYKYVMTQAKEIWTLEPFQLIVPKELIRLLMARRLTTQACIMDELFRVLEDPRTLFCCEACFFMSYKDSSFSLYKYVRGKTGGERYRSKLLNDE